MPTKSINRKGKTMFQIKNPQTAREKHIFSISILPEIHDKIKTMATEAGLSLSEVVRQMIEYVLEDIEKQKTFSKDIEEFRNGRGQVFTNAIDPLHEMDTVYLKPSMTQWKDVP